MRVLMISKACVVGTYQRKLEELARLPDIELTVIVPPSWRDASGELKLERVHTTGYRMLVEPIRLNGNFHLHDFPTLGRRMREICPDVVHIDEEPYNLATWRALRAAHAIGAKALFFSWQNIARPYPIPFVWGERWTLRTIDHAIAGTQSSADVWRAKGYRGPLRVIQQFGVDPDFFTPDAYPSSSRARGFLIGYAGRLVPEKGVDTLIRALGKLPTSARLEIVGQGPERAALERLARSLGVSDRVSFSGQLASTRLPAFYRQCAVVVIPSRTRPNWKEQFGRVIVEAMACGVPVIGSESGAIPDVVGEGGLTFPEGDVEALAGHLRALMEDEALRCALGEVGRAEVLRKYTHAQVAARTAEVYAEMLAT